VTMTRNPLAHAQSTATDGACNMGSPVELWVHPHPKASSTVPMLCNRPKLHDGNHAWSTTTAARLHEWTPTGEVVR
jgi:hypothetical protein